VLTEYQSHVEERAQQGLPPLPLTAEQVSTLVEQLKAGDANSETLLDLLIHRVPPGVDQAAYVKAGFLTDIAKGNAKCELITPVRATELLGTMMGGYNVQSLIDLLDIEETAVAAEKALCKTLMVYDAYHDVVEKAQSNDNAKRVLQSWAEAEWFTSRPKLAEKITLTVFKVPGETNTDDLSPAVEAWSRPDIPLHAKAMLQSKMPDGLELIEKLKEKGHPLAFVGDVVGTGSSRKSAINSVLWHMGHDIPFVPNKRQGGIILGNNIAPIFFNTAEDSGAMPIECDVQHMEMGDVITIYPYEGKVVNEAGETISEFAMRPTTLADEVRAGGRIPLIIGRGLTDKARDTLGMGPSDVFVRPVEPADTGKGFTLAHTG
jgi:aconitate hydratase 2/2-methylisocitrate dehydratase